MDEDVSKKLLDDVIRLTKNIINIYPRYGQKNNIFRAQILLKEYLTGYTSKNIDTFYSHDIKNHECYVDVKKFDPIYRNYEKIPKHNLLAIFDSGSEGPELILNGHIDVDIVDENKKWKKNEGWKKPFIENNCLYGRGATDMLSGLVSMGLVSNLFLKMNKLKNGKIIFNSVCDEEIGGNGTLRTILVNKDSINNDRSLCIIAEPTKNKMCSESLGFMHITVSFFGESVHMGVSDSKNTALSSFCHMQSHIVDILKDVILNMNLVEKTSHFRFNIGKVKGGIDAAIPVQQVDCEATLFYPEASHEEDFFLLLKKLLENLYDCEVKKSKFGFSGAAFSSDKFPHFLSKHGFHLFPSPCDARLYKHFSIPTIVWGPGSLRQAHSVNEFIEVEQISLYINHFWEFLCRYFDACD